MIGDPRTILSSRRVRSHRHRPAAMLTAALGSGPGLGRRIDHRHEPGGLLDDQVGADQGLSQHLIPCPRPAELVRLLIATVSRYSSRRGLQPRRHAALHGPALPAPGVQQTTPLMAVRSSSISSPASATTVPGVPRLRSSRWLRSTSIASSQANHRLPSIRSSGPSTNLFAPRTARSGAAAAAGTH